MVRLVERGANERGNGKLLTVSYRTLVAERVANGDCNHEVLKNPTVIQLRHVSISYNRDPRRKPSTQWVLRDVSLDLRQHAITALIGPSGVGKSSIVRAINGLYASSPDTPKDRRRSLMRDPLMHIEGEILYEGTSIWRIHEIDLRNTYVGTVAQKANLLHGSIFDNIALGLRWAGYKDNLRTRVEEALNEAALLEEVKDRLGQDAGSLSLGQQQRLCIARALALRPDVLLLDEPAGPLDPISTQQIEELLGHLKADHTILTVTHNMQQAARIADCVGVILPELVSVDGQSLPLGPGRLEAFGTVEQIFLNPEIDSRVERFVEGRGVVA